MESCTRITLLIVLSFNVCSSHVSQWNYVKPHENATCPDDPCMTLEAYTEAVEIYFVSDAIFVFLPGDHYYNANLRLSNVTNMHFQGEDIPSAEQSVRIIFNPYSNMTFTSSYSITFSNLSFTLSGSQTGFSDFFVSIVFLNTSIQLSSLTVVGSKSEFATTAFFCRNSLIEITNVHVAGAKSVFGAALFVFSSTVTLSGNVFSNNLASMNGGAISFLDSTVTFSGVNHFQGNRALYFGGAIIASNTVLRFRATAVFLRNRAEQLDGGGIALDSGTLLLEGNGNLYFIENFAGSVGGAILIYNSTAQMIGQLIVQQNTASQGALGVSTSSIVICVGKSLYINNSAFVGGAITLALGSQMFLSNTKLEKNHANFGGGALSISTNSHMIIQDSLIVNNSAGGIGGAINIASSILQFMGDNYIERNMGLQSGGIDAFLMSRIIFTGNTHFVNNTSGGFGGGFSTTFTNISVQGTLIFFNNSGRQGGAVYGISSTIEFGQLAYVMFERNVATVQGGAIYSIDSTWNMEGNLTFHKNLATLGGAMSLSGTSKLILNKYSEIVYSQNHADTTGGAIYFADRVSINQCRVYERNTVAFCYKPNTTMFELCRRQDDCFIELNADYPFDLLSTNISLTFLNNSAGTSGTVIFGGSLDNCRLYLGSGFQDRCGNKIGREYTENPLPIILQIFMIDNLTSAVSSEPFRVCFCDHNGVPNCEMNVAIDTVRGKQFTLSAVTVGQGNFTVPSSIKADFGNTTSTTLSQIQRVQDTGNTCTDVSYRLFSADSSVTMILFPDGPCRDTGIARHEVKVTFLPCPDGFVDIGAECMCDERLNTFNTSCNVDSGTIERAENSFWVMGLYDNSSYQGLLLHDARCPFDFCVETAVEINLEDPDIQCNHNHSGILCGSCQDGLSLALGSLHCLSCSNAYLSLILVFVLAGIALVVILLLLQLTVAYGTMNGLIFYANVIQVNRDIFFPPGATNVLTVFIAWLNLDLGIETCLYDGMNAYAFIWLQFVFPFYVWFLIGFIIFLSHYSERISRWLGSNPVSMLATLFLLSYSKILQTIIAVLSRTSLQYPDGSSQHVWLYDGSVPYFQRIDHIVLGVFAISAILLLFLPYTILLLCGHWLQAYSHWKIFSWINKLKPFMDAYHAPFKKESRYWTGFLLLVRCALFLTFAFNALGNASINLLTITSVTVGLTAIAWLQNRLYKEIHNDFLEASFILNLCIFAAATYHVRETKGSQDKLAYISVGIVLVIFICIVFYHTFCRISKTSAWKKVPKPDFSEYSVIRKIFRIGDKKAEENGQADGVQVKGSETVQSSSTTVTIVELREPLIED